MPNVVKNWKKELSPEQYRVLREGATEAPFSGEYVDMTDDGMYNCVACNATLFSSKSKFNSLTPGLRGWPSFYEAHKSGAVTFKDDRTVGMSRVEVVCTNCGGHLGHVFEDAGDQPRGTHFCINSCALSFEKKK